MFFADHVLVFSVHHGLDDRLEFSVSVIRLSFLLSFSFNPSSSFSCHLCSCRSSTYHTAHLCDVFSFVCAFFSLVIVVNVFILVIVVIVVTFVTVVASFPFVLIKFSFMLARGPVLWLIPDQGLWVSWHLNERVCCRPSHLLTVLSVSLWHLLFNCKGDRIT